MKDDNRNIMSFQTNGRGATQVASGLTNRTVSPAHRMSVPPPATPAPPPKPKRRRRFLIIGVLVAAVLGAVWLRDWWLVGRFLETTDDAFVGADTTAIASKVPGFVTKVAVTDNQRVRTGDLLALIDDRDYRAELARAEATVQGEEATLLHLDALARLQEATIDQARARTESTAAEKQRAENDALRARTLIRRDVVSAQDFDQMDATATKGRADDDAAKAALIAAQRQLTVIEAQKRQAQAALAHAKAAFELARLNLSYTEIRSPIDGIVGNRHAREGAYTTVGARLMSVVPASGLYVDANFKESQIAYMRPGQRATIEADVLRGVKFDGEVESLAPATGAEFSLLPAENATGNFTKIIQRVPIRIRLEGQASELGKLRPGLSVFVSVDQR
jgi:membrane fusion protein, multidrug efflux system